MTSPLTIGKYEISQELSRGGFAVVYQARDPELDRMVALKVLHPHWSSDPGVTTRFLREARLAARLRHPYIVTVYEAGEADGHYYLAMAYLPGRTLRDLLATAGSLPLEHALPILKQIAAALDYAHGQDVIHRDVKPANIMVEETGEGVQATLTDFGLVKALAEGTVLTSLGTVVGSPEYMAPEQADPNRAAEVGPAADRYALGIVAYEMLTGRVPFPGNTPGTLYAHEHKPVPPPRELRPDLPEVVETVLLKMLAKYPENRYLSAAAFVADLQQACPAEVRRWQPRLTSTAVLKWSWGVAAGLLVFACVVGLGLRELGSLLFSTPPQPTVAVEITETMAAVAASSTPTATLPRPTPTPTPTLGIGSTRRRNTDGMTMVYVPGGTFQMGSADSDPSAQDDEKPQHAVTLDDFWLDRTEVNVEMFGKFVEQTGYQTTAEKEGWSGVYNANTNAWEPIEGAFWQKPLGPGSLADTNHPVVQVSWDDAAAYCGWAGGRLPSEAEWEYAAGGPEGRIYPWGNTFDGAKLNFCDKNCEADWKDINSDDDYRLTAPVGSYPAGASWVDALDLAGNVWEWVNDWYRVNYYANSRAENPTGPDSGDYRVLRGGSWSDIDAYVRTANRHYVKGPDIRSHDIGFRCALSPGN